MTSQEHFAQAERYAVSVLDEIKILARAQYNATSGQVLVLDRDTLEFSQLTLQAADVHLRLAQALRVDPGIRAGE